MLTNPFSFGRVVQEEYFTDREKETKDLISTIRNGQNMIIMSPRRYGKSSLISRVLRNLKNESYIIDLELVNSELELANLLIQKIINKNPFEKIKHWFKTFKIKPSLTFDSNAAEFNVTYESSNLNSKQYLLDAFNFAEKISTKTKKRIIVFDEFQEIRRISNNLERLLRGIFQHHQNVCYIFIGSNRHIISDIFQNSNNPFYKFGKQYSLDVLPYDDFNKYLSNGFSKITNNNNVLAKEILSVTKCHPYYTQQLAHEVFHLLAENYTSSDIVNKAIEQIILHHNAEFNQWWLERNTTERKILVGLAEEKHTYGSNIFLDTYELNATSTVFTSLKAMYHKCILEINKDNKYHIEDLFFKEWINYRRRLR
ncbi:ATP-binding protein [Candidatus Margulisiibacteriota bacterium]